MEWDSGPGLSPIEGRETLCPPTAHTSRSFTSGRSATVSASTSSHLPLSNDKGFFIPTNDLWLLAVLNSALLWWFSWRNLA